MPVYNVTIDDASPLIQYDQWWSDSSHSDSLWSDYADGTFHATEQYGATAKLSFNGSAIYLYGAKRPNHDVYAVTLDGNTQTANGYPGSTTANLFKQNLFSQIGLDPTTPHQIALTNQYSSSVPAYVDLDYAIITAGDGDQSTQRQDITWDDDMAQYSPGWDDSPNGFESGYYNNTMHRTNTANAYATLTFSGNAIAVYGVTSTNHGFFSVALDGAPPIKLNGTIPGDQSIRYQNLLYWAGGLSYGQHSVIITNVDTNGNWLDLDKFTISHWPQTSTGSSAAAAPTNSQGGGSSGSGGNNGKDKDQGSATTTHHSNTGAIVGGVVAAVAVAALLGLLAWWLLRRRARRGLDRIEHAPERKDGVLAENDAPLAHVDPFVPTRWAADERTPFSPGALAGGPHAQSSFGGSVTDFASTTAGRSERTEGSKYILPMSPNSANGYGWSTAPPVQPTPAVESTPAPLPVPAENPHQDFPPPNYEQATAAGSTSQRSRGPLPPVPPQQSSPPLPPEPQLLPRKS
ncbi:hypothetical protein PsYK624_107030 [Phanerochaete sordida]|uniref:Transmembrane protein n=1 Tax=Phanerochaete sordida TaxID=48140 RepID=A0A9P3GED6_9APHY|nr:hypothetical protein PsYK624_107030 [Phanerochaete sordida]